MDKSRIHLGEIIGVQVSSACNAGSENCTFYIQERLQNTICVGNLQLWSNVHPAYCWVDVDNSKSVTIKSWNIVWGERTEVPKFEQRDTSDSLLQSKIIHFYTIFPTTLNVSTATDDIRSPNTMSSVTFSRSWVKFSSNLSGSPTSSGYWQFPVASCIEVKSNTST